MVKASDRPRRRFSTWTYVSGGRADVEEYASKYALNETGTRLWVALDGSRTLASLASELAMSTSADEGACLADAIAFVSELIELGLAEIP